METDKRDSKGRFAAGNSGKPKGSTHTTTKVRKTIFKTWEQIVNIEGGEEKGFIDLYTKLPAKDRLEFIKAILPYIAGKINSVDDESEKREAKSLEIIVKDGNIEPISKELEKFKSRKQTDSE